MQEARLVEEKERFAVVLFHFTRIYTLPCIRIYATCVCVCKCVFVYDMYFDFVIL